MERTRFAHRRQSSNFKYHIGALIAVSAWGASFICTKVLLEHGLSAVEIYIYRFILAYLCTLCICPRPFLANDWKDELKFVLAGICGGSVYFIAENTAVMYTLVANVSLITTTAPIIATIMLSVIYKNEKLSWGIWAGSVVAFIGVGFVIFNSSVVVKVNPLGDLLSLLAAVCWAVYNVMLRPLNAVYSVWFISRKTFFYGVITALPFLALDETHCPLSVFLNVQVLISIAFLGFVASLLSYILWAQAIKHVGAVKSQNYQYITPIVTLILSAWLLKEPISIVGAIGCTLILGGVILGEKVGKSAPDSAPQTRR
ncbi:MAG: DMT family transporter [Bacteroidales bacterium]|nr:DMT family transporter [Bacteroidales bacterium]